MNDEQLKELRNLAELFYTPKEIAIVLEVSTFELISAIQEAGSAEYQAFHGARLKSEAELRKAILKLAKQGSSPAQTISMQLFKDSKLKLLDR